MDTKSAYSSFQDLEVWQAARKFKLDVYSLVKQLPNDEKYQLISQLNRAASSVPANIAEGYGRYTYKDQIRFCTQARGSLYECINHVIDANDKNYIREEYKEQMISKAMDVAKLINGYITWLRKMIESKP